MPKHTRPRQKGRTKAEYTREVRLQRVLNGQCRDCGKPATKTRCGVCMPKYGNNLVTLNESKAKLKHHLRGAQTDRRWNGKTSRALGWALATRRG